MATAQRLTGYQREVAERNAEAILDAAEELLVPEQAWQIAVDGRGEVRERRADGACAGSSCAHRQCWVEEAHVAELTGLLREGPHGDQLAGWPAAMRVFARRERPHPGAQRTLFEAEDGWRSCLWVTNRPAATKGRPGHNAYIDAGSTTGLRTPSAPARTPGWATSRPLISRSTPRG